MGNYFHPSLLSILHSFARIYVNASLRFCKKEENIIFAAYLVRDSMSFAFSKTLPVFSPFSRSYCRKKIPINLQPGLQTRPVQTAYRAHTRLAEGPQLLESLTTHSALALSGCLPVPSVSGARLLSRRMWMSSLELSQRLRVLSTLRPI